MSNLSLQKIKTFSVGFRLNKYNELPYSRIVAGYFGTDHNEIFVEPDFDSFLEAASVFDEPLGDPSIFPTYYGAKLAGENVNVVLSGDGADSLFLGTKTHRLTKRYGKIKRFFVPPIDWISGRVAGLVPEEAKWRIFIEGLTPDEFFMRRELLFGKSLRRKLFQGWVLEELEGSFDEADHDIEYKAGTLTERMMFAELHSHRNNTIFKVETTARNFSLNVRAPFVDTRVLEFAFSKVPGNLKIKGNVTKYLLKQLARKFLPPEFPFNRKQGLNPPFSEWLRDEWRDYLWDILMSGEERYLDRKFIRKLIKRHADPMFDQGRKLFALLVFKIWEREYLAGI